MLNCQFLTKITSNKSKHLLVDKHLIQAILEVKIILKKMTYNIIQYFSQCADTLNELLVLVMTITFITGNPKDCLMKELVMLEHLIIVQLQAVSFTKNADIDRYGYSGYGIGFDRHGSLSFPSTGLGRNVIIFGVDISSSTKIDNREKDILILGKGPTQGYNI